MPGSTAAATSPAPHRRRGALARLRVGAGAAGAAIAGLLPHALHHAGPLAGAALFAGAGGSLLFGALGLVAAAPLLIRLRRRSGGWRLPGALLVLFAAMFALSTFVLGPALRADGDARRDHVPPAGHERHH